LLLVAKGTAFQCFSITTPSASNNSAPGIWYAMVGTGEMTQLQVFADHDTQISVYSGESCDALECVSGNDDSASADGDSASNLGISMDSGVSYRILVHGFNGAAGNFVLQISAAEVATNDECSKAIELKLGRTLLGSTLYALKDEGIEICGRYVE
jgi:hypothetical protein